jgi:hypothetical protein
MKVLDWGRPFPEVEAERCSKSTSSALMVLMIHPDRTISSPGPTKIRSPDET